MEPSGFEPLTPCSQCSGSLDPNHLQQLGFYTLFSTYVRQVFVPAEPLTAIWRTLWRTKMIFSRLGVKKAALESRQKTCQ